ncbi:MAG: DUF4145 domain-containing protein [Nitrososphaera sp.]|uniref:DUF4145 domain-containing protein n=1 Tax=Nitrososphaera sp. TaxID=1971748 RepID=UPI003D6DD34C
MSNNDMPFTSTRDVSQPSYSEQRGWYQFTCGHCGNSVNAYVAAIFPKDASRVRWLLCTQCGNGSVLTEQGVIYPPAPAGPSLEGLPPDIEQAYKEARNCFSFKAYAACEQVCRKILMYVGVEKGERECDTFENYLTHLENEGYVTKPMKSWVEQIRKNGNKATHKLDNPGETRAKSTLMFTAELLRLIYEMDYVSKHYGGTPPP